MVDRQEIDALLIGSLYGELSSADEARLQAHLESHPADRTALHGLERARNAVRESRILQVQLEPPQSVTALLLQEAARRAPRPARTDDEGWFRRFLRTFVAHPAMAAATMLVVVLGVAGTLYLRQGDEHLSAGTASPPPAAAEKQEMAPASEPAVAATTAGDGKAGYGVRLADGAETANAAKHGDLAEQRARQAQDQPAQEPAPSKTDSAPAVAQKVRKTPPSTFKPAEDKLAKKEVAAPRTTGPNRVLEVATPQRAPLEIADDEKSVDRTDRTVARSDNMPAAPGGGGAPAAQAAPAPADAKPMPPSRAPEGRVARGAGTSTPAPTAPPPPPPAPAPRNEPSKDKAAVAVKGQLDENRRDAPSPELAWARDAHARVVAQVRAGNCPDAARLALTLSQRAPAYYEANVLHDRQLKDCVVYINAERDREAERDRVQRAKAAKRSVEEPAKKAPAADTGKADTKAEPVH